jgi:hypothetical protein
MCDIGGRRSGGGDLMNTGARTLSTAGDLSYHLKKEMAFVCCGFLRLKGGASC